MQKHREDMDHRPIKSCKDHIFEIWGYITDKIFATLSPSKTHLKRRIIHTIRSISTEMPKKVWEKAKLDLALLLEKMEVILNTFNNYYKSMRHIVE